MIRNGTFLTAALMFSTTAFAQGAPSGCADYPYTNGMNVEMLDAGPKIIATASVGVSFDDVDAVNDARDEATLAAKAMIARFFAESVTSDEGIKKAVQETKSMQGDSKQASRTEAVDRIKVLTNSSKALLRGVLPLGDCYTPGKEMRVSVGLKPETIAAAGKAAGGINSSLSANPTPTASPSGQAQGAQDANASVAATPSATGTSPGGPAQPLNNVPGFSNTKNLNKF